MKTDLNLRPIHHSKDDRSDVHLFLGLLSYWIVNTTQADCYDALLDRNSQDDVHSEGYNDRGHKCIRRESPFSIMQRTEQISERYIRTIKVQEDAFQKNQNKEKFVVHNKASKNRKSLIINKNIQ